MFPRFDSKLKTTLFCLFFLFFCYYFGLLTHIFERDFYKEFDYPLAGDVFDYVRQLRRGKQPTVPPFNFYNFTFVTTAEHKCRDSEGNLIKPRLVIVVKSAMKNVERRNAIRNTWAYEKRFSDVPIRTIFTLGVGVAPGNHELQELIDVEQAQFNDIVQARFIDTYFNNTIKTMMGIKWAMTFCPRSKFYLFVDDDFYISVKNILKFVRNPANYPEYIEEAEEMMRQVARKLTSSPKVTPRFHYLLDDEGRILKNR